MLGFYTDYASSFDKELRLAVNICELQHVKERNANSISIIRPGIDRLVAVKHAEKPGNEKVDGTTE